MTQLSRIAAALVLVGGLSAVLSSCSGDPAPIVTQTPSPTWAVEVTPSPSPSPTPSMTPQEELLAQIPQDAREENFYSASQFARFFLGLYPAMFATDGDTQLFEYLAGENCGFCSNALTNVEETREVDAYSNGGEFTFPDVLASGGLQDDGYWYVADRFETAPGQTYGPTGDLLDTAPSFVGEVRLRLEYLVDHWRVDEVDFEFDDA